MSRHNIQAYVIFNKNNPISWIAKIQVKETNKGALCKLIVESFSEIEGISHNKLSSSKYTEAIDDAIINFVKKYSEDIENLNNGNYVHYNTIWSTNMINFLNLLVSCSLGSAWEQTIQGTKGFVIFQAI